MPKRKKGVVEEFKENLSRKEGVRDLLWLLLAVVVMIAAGALIFSL